MSATRRFGLALLAVALAQPLEARTGALPFRADDYPQALAEAKSRKLPLFIEAWAPW